jgi:hypothetical protein
MFYIKIYRRVFKRIFKMDCTNYETRNITQRCEYVLYLRLCSDPTGSELIPTIRRHNEQSLIDQMKLDRVDAYYDGNIYRVFHIHSELKDYTDCDGYEIKKEWNVHV